MQLDSQNTVGRDFTIPHGTDYKSNCPKPFIHVYPRVVQNR